MCHGNKARCRRRRLLRWAAVVSGIAMIMFWSAVITVKNVEWLRVRDAHLLSVVRRMSLHSLPTSQSRKVDWHDYGQIERDAKREGPGENGNAASVKPEDKERAKELIKAYGYNAFLSDMIALDRSLPDIRHEGCKTKLYPEILPSVSVIIPIHDESWSVLLRTVTSVINRTPARLLKEIILVDDGSTKEHLKSRLETYVHENMVKVRMVRLPQREGLIAARLAGARLATAEVLVFFDAHVEVNVNWLPPLLEPIVKNYATCTCPFIDVINDETFKYTSQDEGRRGSFNWKFLYKRLPLLPEDHMRPTEPFKSPVMAGGLFAISAKFFWELGGYDTELRIWGGEQYELSFKIWQCGGSIVDTPCSRVGHIFRNFTAFFKGQYVLRNFKRVAEVWMDEYKEYLYKRLPLLRNIDTGDLTEQKMLRARLKCKPFRWFMDEVAFDLLENFPAEEPPILAQGRIRSHAFPNLCVDSAFVEKFQSFGLKECIKNQNLKPTTEQNFTLTWKYEIRSNSRPFCWDVPSIRNKAPLTLYLCHQQKGNQFWRYLPETSWLVQGNNHHRCLDIEHQTKNLHVDKCDKLSQTQKWKFDYVNLTALQQWNKI